MPIPTMACPITGLIANAAAEHFVREVFGENFLRRVLGHCSSEELLLAVLLPCSGFSQSDFLT